jgi:hypothetical protein
MNPIEGQPGELLDHLTQLLNNDALGDGGWYNISSYVEVFLGGRALHSVVPDTGPPMPGSVGEMMRQQHEVVSRERYFELVRERLGELVAVGLEEAFLVRSVRDAVRQELEFMTDTGQADRNREEIRAFIERQAEDPAKISEFRAMLAEEDPSADQLTDGEIAERLRNMTKRLLPTSADEAVQKWGLLTRWDQQAADLLPDAIFAEWRQRRYRRP